MILTDDFVYIHPPKTAGTFVTHVLSRLYGGAGGNGCFVDTNKHGTCSEIPPRCAGLPIVSTTRSPYDRYVSQYRFGWWVLHPERYCGREEMRRMFPHYPDISFAEFLELANTRFVNCFRGRPSGFENHHFPPQERLGWQTEQFVRFFFPNPREAFARIDEDYLERKLYRREMFGVRFLHTERLNRELHDFLLELGHRPADLAFIPSAGRVLPAEGGRDPGDHWQGYYTPELRSFVRTRERLLFEIFPEFDV